MAGHLASTRNLCPQPAVPLFSSLCFVRCVALATSAFGPQDVNLNQPIAAQGARSAYTYICSLPGAPGLGLPKGAADKKL